MKIESNIAGIIGQVRRLQEVIPVAMERALRPARWGRFAQATAYQVLNALMLKEERQYFPKFLDTLRVLFLDGGLNFRMASPWLGFNLEQDALSQAQAAASARSNTDLGMGLFDRPITEFEAAIQQWVETEKRKDKRDWGKSDEQVAHLISYILLTADEKLGVKGKAAKAALMPHITKWLQKRSAPQMKPERIELLLLAVLAAWREGMRAGYGRAVSEEIGPLMGELV
jgi:hypothetical protein